MPEGDTIYRAARGLRDAVAGRQVTACRTRVAQIRALGPRRLVGQTLARVESRGKHMLLWFAPSGLALHTHMRMTGSWHLYRPGQRWGKPERLATIVLEFGDVTAVCFSAPVCELLSVAQVARQRGLADLGPDALADDVDLGAALANLDARHGTTIGEALLDQRVIAGIGNVYKSEVLFIHGVDPWTPVGDLSPQVRRELLETAVALLRRNAVAASPARVTTGRASAGHAGSDRLHVYGKARRPCPRCRTPLRAAPQGEQARRTFWCPTCQGPGPTLRHPRHP